MPDIPERDQLEKELARKLGRLFSGFSGHLLEILEQYNWDVTAIPESFWQQHLTQKEIETLIPFLERASLASAERMLETTTIGVDWALVNEEAANWARTYSTLLAGQIDTTSRSAISTGIRNSVATYFEEGLSIQELTERLEADPKLQQLFTRDVKDRLGRIYGPSRAEMIAVTETTRAASEGEMIIVSDLAKQGVYMTAIWETAMDEIVCNICWPLQGKEADSYDMRRRPSWTHPKMGIVLGPPPAHPRCRCGWRNETQK